MDFKTWLKQVDKMLIFRLWLEKTNSYELIYQLSRHLTAENLIEFYESETFFRVIVYTKSGYIVLFRTDPRSLAILLNHRLYLFLSSFESSFISLVSL